MKKKLLGIMSLVAIATVTVWNYQEDQEIQLSDLALKNVNALANEPIKPKDCPGGRHLCVWVNQTTYYDHSGPDDI
ncbi:MAG: NVEALA domain-containing protein [Parabacteroides sp.]|nr:NVEALA domain-containing protein [Parabacteroides sp.]